MKSTKVSTAQPRASTQPRVSFEKPKKEVKRNSSGNKVIENWCLYVQWKAQQEREKNKKTIVISKVTDKDRKVFKEAYNKLQKERAKSEGPQRKALKKLASSRTVKRSKSEKSIPKPADNYVPCPIDYKKALERTKSQQSIKSKKPAESKTSTRRAIVEIPPLKTKPWAPPAPPKRKPRPVVVIPPFKTRPWNPCLSRAKPINKPTIEYPPLTLRKT